MQRQEQEGRPRQESLVPWHRNVASQQEKGEPRQRIWWWVGMVGGPRERSNLEVAHHAADRHMGKRARRTQRDRR